MSSSNLKLDIELPHDYTFNVDTFIKNFENGHVKTPGQRLVINEYDCKAICILAKRLFSDEMTLLEISAPTKICGDLHGQWYDLMRIFQHCGQPAVSRYLFLGDYVDRGTCSLETICILFAYKIKFPHRIFLLRGNHESALVNKIYGFYDEIMARFDSDLLYNLFNSVFDYLPIAAIVDGTIFCCHGGLSPEFLKAEIKDLKNEFQAIKRPLDVPQEGLICDILWSDPIDYNEEMDKDFAKLGWALNSRGCSFVFSPEIVKQFLEKFNLELIVRAHQVVPDGYEFFSDRSLVTLFSVSNYCGCFDNAAAVLIVEKRTTDSIQRLQGGFQVLTPNKEVPMIWMKVNKKKNLKKQIDGKEGPKDSVITGKSNDFSISSDTDTSVKIENST